MWAATQTVDNVDNVDNVDAEVETATITGLVDRRRQNERSK